MQLPSFKLSLQLLTPVLTDIKRQIYNLFPVLNKEPATVATTAGGTTAGGATTIVAPSPVAIQIKSKYSIIHSLTHLLTYSLTYSLTHSLPLG